MEKDTRTQKPELRSCYEKIGREWAFSIQRIANPLKPNRQAILGKIWWDDTNVEDLFYEEDGRIVDFFSGDIDSIEKAELKIRAIAIRKFSSEAGQHDDF